MAKFRPVYNAYIFLSLLQAPHKVSAPAPRPYPPLATQFDRTLYHYTGVCCVVETFQLISVYIVCRAGIRQEGFCLPDIASLFTP